ncbi:cadherin domain-containing protein [Stieleria sp. TO1_6]|uniref:cadherin domain-containing protein n=1 Tax=Stieleria tagensis TaxID=2956795 RepID=UPI00209A9F28|nr:cadherin domain-containing protein [Stieleria tagensis]MCO8122918.1 cadherin domain-containing protein [Stieleria tagensis]
MSRSRGPVQKRRLGYQSLERRELLAAHLSELLVSPLFGNNDTDQMVELRGEPGATLDDGTYLVVASERAPNYGEIHGIFDLSGQSFGDNGYLVLLQQDSTHVPVAQANVLQSTATGFGGLPGGIYTDSHPLSDRIDFIIGPNGYFLIQTNVVPTLGQNIDANADLLIDPVVSGDWNILDSISLHSFVGRGDKALGEIVFAEIGATDPVIATREGVQVIPTEGFGYAGRVGETIGSTESDWIASTVVDESPAGIEARQWALADNLFGVPNQYAFVGRDLDHVGEANFVGGARGHIVSSESGLPAVGVQVFADTNENNLRDNLEYVFDPDGIVLAQGVQETYPLVNAFPGTTVTNFALDSFPASNVTAEPERDFPNTLANHIFATGGISWFSSGGVLRFDFYEPVNAVSLVAIGSDNSLSPVYARIEAYNEAGELLASDLSSELIDSQREVIGVSTGQDDIAYVFAYSDESVEGGGPFGRFDRMKFSQYELAATTDESGYYEIENLFPESYEIKPVGYEVVGEIPQLDVIRYEHATLDFEIDPNRSPVIDDAVFEIDENSLAGVLVGQMIANDPDGESLSFRFDGVVEEFSIDETTGEIVVLDNADLDFETAAKRTLTVIVDDEQGKTSSASVTVNLLNVNEAPEISYEPIRIDEGSFGQIGMLQVSDPDIGQTHQFQLVGGTAAGLVEVSPQGLISILPGAEFDYETAPEYTLVVSASDSGNPVQTTEKTIVISLNDLDEPPTFNGEVQTQVLTSGHRFELQLPDGYIFDPEGDAWTASMLYGGQPTPNWLQFDPTQLTLSGTPTSYWIGHMAVTLTVESVNDPGVAASTMFELVVMSGDNPLHHVAIPHDVNVDYEVTPIDALRVINHLARYPEFVVDNTARVDALLDVNSDKIISPLDALFVINKIGQDQVSGTTEGEQTASSFLQPTATDEDRDDAIAQLYGDWQLF